MEVNFTFYRLPTTTVFASWHERAPKGFEFARFELTSGWTYIRLHEGSQNSCYTEQQLENWATKIESWSRDGIACWVYFNNAQKGHALADAQSLRGASQRRALPGGPPQTVTYRRDRSYWNLFVMESHVPADWPHQESAVRHEVEWSQRYNLA